MRRLALGGALLVLSVAPAALAAGSAPRGETAIRPMLRLVDRDPFIVRGQHFKAGEAVTVVLTVREQRSLKLTANDEGAFTANFGDVAIPRCTGFVVWAVGARGSRAVMKPPPAPACLTDAKPDRASG